MTQIQSSDDNCAMRPTKPETDDSLERIRAAAQELHAAITDATAKRGAAMKAELHSIPAKAKAVTTSLEASLAEQRGAIKKDLGEAVTSLKATEKHLGESLKNTGHGFEASVKQALINARAAVQKISEAVAAKRTAEGTHARAPATPAAPSAHSHS